MAGPFGSAGTSNRSNGSGCAGSNFGKSTKNFAIGKWFCLISSTIQPGLSFLYMVAGAAPGVKLFLQQARVFCGAKR
jgi:hypothetical protein